MSVAIPAEIVGDKYDLLSRRDSVDQELLVDALCIGRRLAESGEVGEYFHADLVELVKRRDVLAAEIDRRYVAEDLARADEPHRQRNQDLVRARR
jgi:hypothetical protein